jgi:hypothetical protein
MRKIVIMTMAALAAFLLDSISFKVFADGVGGRPHARTCGRFNHCSVPIPCPPWTCHSLYGAYGPYGGRLYWGRYTYAGWGRP